MRNLFLTQVVRGFFLVSEPYNPSAYYAVITAYALTITWIAYRLLIA